MDARTKVILNSLYGKMSTEWFDINSWYPPRYDYEDLEEAIIDNIISHHFKGKICEMHYRLNLISYEEYNNKDACHFNRFKMSFNRFMKEMDENK